MRIAISQRRNAIIGDYLLEGPKSDKNRIMNHQVYCLKTQHVSIGNMLHYATKIFKLLKESTILYKMHNRAEGKANCLGLTAFVCFRFYLKGFRMSEFEPG